MSAGAKPDEIGSKDEVPRQIENCCPSHKFEAVGPVEEEVADSDPGTFKLPVGDISVLEFVRFDSSIDLIRHPEDRAASLGAAFHGKSVLCFREKVAKRGDAPCSGKIIDSDLAGVGGRTGKAILLCTGTHGWPPSRFSNRAREISMAEWSFC